MSKINFPHVASRVLNALLLLEPGYARMFFNALSTRLGIQNLYDAEGLVTGTEKMRVRAGLFDEGGSSTADHRPYRLVNGVAVLPVNGTLVHKHGYLQPYSGMTGYDGIIARLQMALSDAKVDGVLLDFDTPGGEVAGCFDAAQHIRKLADESDKAVWGLCCDMNASAGMALASATQRRLITQTGVAGSVGVVMGHVSYEEYLEKEGIDVTLIHSGAHKVDGNPYENLPGDVLSSFQAKSDKLRDEFASLVSELTGMDKQAVLDTEARCYRGQEAIDVGFADELVNGNQAIDVFADYLSGQASNPITTGGTSMTKEKSQTASAEKEKPAAAATGGDPAPVAPTTTASTEDQRMTERARIQSILGSDEAQGRASLAEHFAYKTDMSVEEALTALAAAPASTQEAGASPLDQAMSTTASVAVGADSDRNTGASDQNESQAMMADYHKAKGVRPKN